MKPVESPSSGRYEECVFFGTSTSAPPFIPENLARGEWLTQGQTKGLITTLESDSHEPCDDRRLLDVVRGDHK